MRIVNHTELDTDRIKKLFIKCKTGLKSSGLLIEIKTCKVSYHGRAWNCDFYMPKGTKKYTRVKNAIELFINPKGNKDGKYIFWIRQSHGWKKYDCLNIYNLLTMLYLHEISHVKDYQRKRSSKYRQKHCDKYAVKQGLKFGLIEEVKYPIAIRPMTMLMLVN